MPRIIEDVSFKSDKFQAVSFRHPVKVNIFRDSVCYIFEVLELSLLVCSLSDTFTLIDPWNMLM